MPHVAREESATKFNRSRPPPLWTTCDIKEYECNSAIIFHIFRASLPRGPLSHTGAEMKIIATFLLFYSHPERRREAHRLHPRLSCLHNSFICISFFPPVSLPVIGALQPPSAPLAKLSNGSTLIVATLFRKHFSPPGEMDDEWARGRDRPHTAPMTGDGRRCVCVEGKLI